MTPERLRINAEDLSDISRETLAEAFVRARRELIYFASVAELRDFANHNPKSYSDHEAAAAWLQLTKFVDKYVGSDVYGNCDPGNGTFDNPPPLPSRILQSVRLVGGWKVLKRMNEQDYPFVQKRFFDAYKSAEQISGLIPTSLELAAQLKALEEFKKLK